MKRLIVTGAGGFIGRILVDQAAAAGIEVLALGRSLPADGLRPGVRWHQCDVWNPATYDHEITDFQPEALVHLAWYAEPGLYLHSPLNLEAHAGSLRLLQTSLAAGCRTLIGAGTCAEFDARSGYLRNESPTAPSTLYAACKLSLKGIGEQLCAQAGASWAWGRIFYLYGPGEDRRRAVPALISNLLANRPFPATDGMQIRDYLHVADVAAGFLTLACSGASGTFNICSGTPTTMRALFQQVAGLTGGIDLVQFGQRKSNDWDPPFICGDPSALHGLGWSPVHDLESGLQDTLRWWRHQLAGG